MTKTRVLIVDDSSTIRRLIRSALQADPRIDIVAEAGNASEARDAVNEYSPDVMTLDVEMPNMSGLEFLRRLMKHRPMPVVMISTLTAKGSAAAIEALSLGAIECIEKPRFGQAQNTFEQLADLLVQAGQARVRDSSARNVKRPEPKRSSFSGNGKTVLIGGSTGAVEVIETILKGYPENCPPTLITQHMPAPFLASFAARLDPLVAPKVRLACDGDPIVPGQVLLAPGGAYHLNVEPGINATARLVEGPKVSGHRPSVDSMFQSAVPMAPNIVAAILTGMGRDGAAGMRALSDGGADTVGQNAESCIVFGMPRVASEMGAVQTWVHLDDLSAVLLEKAGRKAMVKSQ